MCKYIIHYFSGTGNTYHLAKTIERELKNKGYAVELLNIEKDNFEKFEDYEMHIFCFPVYGFGTPSIMLKYISSLNVGDNKKAAIVCTSAGFEGQALSHFKHLLKKKGFDVIFLDMVTYTYNWTQFFNPPSEEHEEQILKKAEINITEITRKIINNESRFLKRNFIGLAISWIFFIGFSKLGRKILGKSFIADSSCVNCGKCKKVCPAQVIDIYREKPRWSFKCEGCQRCINICPRQSIQLSIVKLAIFIIAGLLPILLIMDLNNYIGHLSKIVNIILYLIIYFGSTVLANAIINVMEKIEAFRKLLRINYTKKYRRNIAKGFRGYEL